MPATTKKRVIAIYLTTANVTASSYQVNGGTAITKTGFAVGGSTITTPAALASLFGTGLLSNAANIEAVVNIATQSTNRLVLARLAPVAAADTLTNATVNQSTVVRTFAVSDIPAFADPGLAQDAELAAVESMGQALSSVLMGV